MKLRWAQKQLFWSFEKTIFHFFPNNWLTKLKPFFGKVKQSVQNYLNQNLVIGTSAKKVLKLSWSKKRMFWAFEKSIFQYFLNLWVTKLKPFLEEARQSLYNYLNQSLARANFLDNGFEATFSSKTMVLKVWKNGFSHFCKSLTDEVETIFWESETKRSKLFKSKFGHGKLSRKLFWKYL